MFDHIYLKSACPVCGQKMKTGLFALLKSHVFRCGLCDATIIPSLHNTTIVYDKELKNYNSELKKVKRTRKLRPVDLRWDNIVNEYLNDPTCKFIIAKDTSLFTCVIETHTDYLLIWAGNYPYGFGEERFDLPGVDSGDKEKTRRIPTDETITKIWLGIQTAEQLEKVEYYEKYLSNYQPKFVGVYNADIN